MASVRSDIPLPDGINDPVGRLGHLVGSVPYLPDRHRHFPDASRVAAGVCHLRDARHRVVDLSGDSPQRVENIATAMNSICVSMPSVFETLVSR